MGKIALTLLLSETPPLDADGVRELVSSFDEALGDTSVDVAQDPAGRACLAVRFGRHEVYLRGVDGPIPEPLVEPCIQLAHYDADDKETARAHRAALFCEHAPTEDPLSGFVAVAAVAGALAPIGASTVVNLGARTSVPAALLAKDRPEMLEHLRRLPPPLLYAGFAKYVVEGVPGVWMRTHGAPVLGLPNLARHARGHEQGSETFALFSDVMLYLLETRVEMAPGDVAQVGEDRFTLVRGPRPDEDFLIDEGEALVIDVLDEKELAALGSPAGSA
jgi:hypothetical protein